ncbi:YybH family protein [Rhizobium leguminosarum]|uniref:YybH family protein n=1 Tax=Rhizobium leguminosarum TaxID=384 RepID=UPI003F94E232
MSGIAYLSVSNINQTGKLEGKPMSQLQADKTAIENVVDVYSTTISRSDAEALVSLFTHDGVVMAPDAPTMAGAGQLKAFFDHGFTMIRMNAKIHVDEIAVSGEYAFARCHSEVHMTLLETNVSHFEENRELFVFRKDSGTWKIARYMFNKLPAAH